MIDLLLFYYIGRAFVNTHPLPGMFKHSQQAHLIVVPCGSFYISFLVCLCLFLTTSHPLDFIAVH